MSAEAWLWLADGLGYGAVNSGELLAAYPGGAQQVAQELGSEKLDEILTQKQAERLASSLPGDFSLCLAHAAAEGIAALSFDDDNYPELLRSIPNPPPVLFVKGDLSLLNGQLSIGIVGARRPSAYGVEAVKAIGRGVALGGAVIISGLAAGLDSEAHKAALAVNGPTIACIAFGHDTCYPASNKKLMEVIERYGAVVSEYPLGTGAEKPFFLQRNRLIAGMSHGLVVAEARRQSGTMSTVNFATDYGRDVFGVPGSIFSDLSGGTNAMIREGAYLAGSASDILAVYGIELEEDPVDAVAKQAQEGRPAAAPAAPPPWQQNLARQTALHREERAKEQEAQEKPWAQTLAEALQSELAAEEGTSDGRVSSKAAVDAFRRLQGSLPPTDDSEVDARNRALDEMVAAVSDTVEFGGGKNPAPKKKPVPPPESGPKVSPFPWNKVEHLSKEEMAKMRAAGQKKGNQNKAAAQSVPGGGSSLSPVGRVERVARVEPVVAAGAVVAVPRAEAAMRSRPPEAAAPSGRFANSDVVSEDFLPRSQPAEKRTAPAAQDEFVPFAPRRETSAAPVEQQNKTEPLSARLRTLSAPEASAEMTRKQKKEAVSTGSVSGRAAAEHTAAEKQVEAILQEDLTGHLDMDAEEAAAPDPMALLSPDAQKAFQTLGPAPVSLSDICDASGLSPGAAMAALTELELAGLSRQLAGRQFVIMQ